MISIHHVTTQDAVFSNKAASFPHGRQSGTLVDAALRSSPSLGTLPSDVGAGNVYLINPEEVTMSRTRSALFAVAVLATAIGACGVSAQQTGAPPFATTKVEGTDNVYIFRNGGHQAMFVVTPDGVIATDPIAYGRPTGGQTYLDEIRKVTDKSVKYVIYSHHHFDHIAGGKAFKDAGATFIAHRRAKERLEALRDPHTVIPDEAVSDSGRTITLGGTRLELSYHGLNHSDSTLVMRLPKEKIVFVVDTLPVGQVPGRGMIDFHPLETETFIKGSAGAGMGPVDPRPPGTQRSARDEEGRAGPARAAASGFRRDEEAGAGR